MPVGNIQARFNQIRNTLTESDQLIGDWIFEDPARAARLTIYDWSDEIGVAKSTISKFVRKLGYRGFREFRNDLLRTRFDPPSSVASLIETGDSPATILHKTFNTSIRMIHETLDTIDDAQFNRAVEIISTSNLVAFFGFGASATLAQSAHRQFAMTSIHSRFEPDFHTQLVVASELSPRDCAIVISLHGGSRDVNRILAELAPRGCRIIAITSNINSDVSRNADCTLLLPKNEGATGTEVRSLRPAQEALFNALFDALVSISGSEAVNKQQSIAAVQRARN